MTKVVVNARGCYIEVEAAGAKSADLMKLALEAHAEACGPEAKPGPAMGFQVERAPAPSPWDSGLDVAGRWHR